MLRRILNEYYAIGADRMVHPAYLFRKFAKVLKPLVYLAAAVINDDEIVAAGAHFGKL